MRTLHYALAAGLLVFYGYYVWETMRAEGDLGDDCKPLYFHRHPEMPHRYRIFTQIGVAILGIVLGAEIFVHEVQLLSETLGAAPLVVSLLITPIATELPGEVQLGAVDPPEEGHAGAGQHHRRDGLPEHLPGVDRSRSSPRGN